MARPRAADYDDKSQAILDAAASLFADRGVDGTSMSMIASAASGSKAWLYHYYDSKDAIVEGLLTTFLESLLDAAAAASTTPASPELRLRRLITDVVRVCNDAPGRARLFEISNALPVAPRRRVARLRHRFVSAIDNAVIATEPRLVDRPGLRTAMVQSILGLLNWQHQWWTERGPLDLDSWGEAMADLVLGGIPLVVATDPPQRHRARHSSTDRSARGVSGGC